MTTPPPVPEATAAKAQDAVRRHPVPAVALPLAIAASALSWQLMRRRQQPITETALHVPEPSLAEHLLAAEQAMQQDDVAAGYRHLFAVLQEIVACRTGLPAGAICAVPDDMDLPSSTAIQTLLSRCDSVRYGCLRPPRNELAADIESARMILNSMASISL